MLEDIINNDRKSQIILLILLTAALCQDNKALNPLFKICDQVGCSNSALHSGHDCCQVPCTLSNVGFNNATNAANSTVTQLKTPKWREAKTVSLHFAGKSLRGGLLATSGNNILKSKALLCRTRQETVFLKIPWASLKNKSICPLALLKLSADAFSHCFQ